MVKTLEELKNYDGPDKVRHWQEYLLEKFVKGDRGQTFKSGFEVFDKELGGIQTGEVVVISGYTKQGKTLFAESWLESIRRINPEARTMILSFEVQADKLLAKYVNRGEAEIYLPSELKTMDFEWLKERCMESIVKYDCNILLIDHLHFMVDMNTKQNMSLNIGAFMRRLKKDIAIDLDMAIILIAHQSGAKDGQQASINTIRDSSFVAQESDSIIVVSRRKDLDDVELIDIRGRHGDFKKNELEDMKVDGKNYSMNLAIVSIERARRTGTFEFKKLFQKRGEFMEEL